MAEGRNIPELGGYDYEFTSNVPECWECLVCHLTLKDPVQIEKCGHRLCNICMESLFRRPSPTCPADRQPLSRDQIFSDTACHRQILDLIVKCSHSECSWTGELRDVEKHQSECLFNVVKCSNSGCTEMLSKRDMKTHETLECSWRKVNCEYCQESVIVNQKQKHFDICRNFPVLCTNKCGLKDIPRQELEFHVLDECPATEVQCEYKNLGCEAVFPRSDAKSHAQTQIESHLNLALRGLDVTQHQVRELVTVMKDQSLQIERQSQHIERQSLQIERQSQQIERQSGQIERLIAKDNEQSQQIERQSQHIERQSLQIERQLQQIERHSGQIERLIAKDNEQSQQIERQSEKIERLISKDKEQSEKMERSMSAVKDPPPQKERCGPINEIFPTPFEFKIRSIGPVRQQARMSTQTLCSEPFYLFAQGYKYLLRIAIFLSSRKPLRGQRGARVYIKVVPGEFDELLSWPCKEKVRVTVVRGGHKKNKSAVTDFGEELCSRPLRDDHHTDRCILALTESQFVSCTKDDSILIRVNRE